MKAAALHTQHDRERARQGFTLVEVLISMTLMGMVFASAFGAYMIGTRMISDAREELIAAQIMQSEIEALRGYNWTDLTGLPTSAEFEPRGTKLKQYANDFECYRYVNGSGSTIQVSIYVSWLNSKDKKASRMATTLFTQNGLNDYYYRRI